MQDKELARTVGATIAARRRQLGLTQEELAEKLEIGQESLSKMEKGIISPKFSRLQGFADTLQCSVADLFRTNTESTAARAALIADMLQPLPDQAQESMIAVMREIIAMVRKSYESDASPSSRIP